VFHQTVAESEGQDLNGTVLSGLPYEIGFVFFVGDVPLCLTLGAQVVEHTDPHHRFLPIYLHRTKNRPSVTALYTE
jgi:hypothetical protein